MILKIATNPGDWIFYDEFRKFRHFYVTRKLEPNNESHFYRIDENKNEINLYPDIIWEWTFNPQSNDNWIGLICRSKYVGEDEVLIITNSPFCYLLNNEGKTIEKIN